MDTNLHKRLGFSIISLGLLSSCVMQVGLQADGEPGVLGEDANVEAATAPLAAGSVVRGYLTFAPDYRRHDASLIGPGVGQIPPNTDDASPLPYLYVCAMDRDGTEGAYGGFDPKPVYGAVNDDVLGCARADVTGYYDIPLRASSDDAAQVYLTTWLCDGPDAPISFTVSGGVTVTYPRTAQVCARMNAQVESGEHRKFLRSRQHTFVDGGITFINWNLSCPNRAGSTTQAQRLACAGDDEPIRTGATNSATAWSKEAVHVFRSAIETVKTFGNLVPKTSEVALTGCGSAGDLPCTPCTHAECLSEVNLFVAGAVVGALPPVCTPTDRANSSGRFHNICISVADNGAAGALNPFRAPHELGHTLQRRWMKDRSRLGQGCTATGWETGDNETGGTAEGWANFIAVASWWNDDYTGMEYEGRNASLPGDAALAGSCGSGVNCACTTGNLLGEGRPTQFFVDLWDADDTVNLSMADLLRVWSTFDLPEESDERGPDGRNLQDFRDHYNAINEEYGWPSVADFTSIMSMNCVDKHTRSALGAADDELICGD